MPNTLPRNPKVCSINQYHFQNTLLLNFYITEPALIAKSNIILDVKPWDDETNMKEMENAVRKIETDGLLWGACKFLSIFNSILHANNMNDTYMYFVAKLVPLAFGIHKLQISCVVEDDKVSVDWLVEQIQELEDYVQSVDIAAFNKV